MNKKQVIRINENQLRQIVTESVKRMLNEHTDYYNRVGREEKREALDSIVEIADNLVFNLSRNGLREINPNVAKEFGFTKSYKRLSKALELAKKVQDLVKAARQDMLGLYTDNENNKNLVSYESVDMPEGGRGYAGSY